MTTCKHGPVKTGATRPATPLPPGTSGWPQVRPLPTQATRRWVRDRLMQARIGGLLTLTALQNLFTAEGGSDEER